jgi:hypothetical protein
VDSDLVESDNASGSDSGDSPPDHGYRIALMNEHIAAQRGIERSGIRNLIVSRYDGFDVVVASGLSSEARGLDRTCFAIDGDDKTRRADGFRKQHRYIACSTTDIQHPHTGLDLAFADQSAGDIGDGSGLDLKALDL